MGEFFHTCLDRSLETDVVFLSVQGEFITIGCRGRKVNFKRDLAFVYIWGKANATDMISSRGSR